jgi:hypothetical protein
MPFRSFSTLYPRSIKNQAHGSLYICIARSTWYLWSTGGGGGDRVGFLFDFFFFRAHGRISFNIQNIVLGRAGPGSTKGGALYFSFMAPSSLCKKIIYVRDGFFKKIKAGALPYHLRRKSNCTSQAEANTTTTTHANNTPNKTLHHLILGEKQEKGTKDRADEATIVPRLTAARCNPK